MSFSVDARIPVIVASPDQVGADDALLCEGPNPLAQASFVPAAPIGHAPGCACCAPRNAAGRALAALLQARARGEIPFFRRVVAASLTDAGQAELTAALAADPVAASCFRLLAT
jgi:hypothetical protein